MDFLGFLIALIMALSNIKSDTVYMPPMSAEGQKLAEAYMEAFEDMGLELGNRHIYFHYRVMPTKYMGGTATQYGFAESGYTVCTGTIAISTQFLNLRSALYSTPEVYAVIAHEASHVAQGALCANPVTVNERSAEIMMYSVLAHLAERGDITMQDALIFELRRSAILAAIDVGGYEVLDRIGMPEAEKEEFRKSDLDYLHTYGKRYWTASLEAIYQEYVNGDKHFATEEGWLYYGDMDSGALMRFIYGLFVPEPRIPMK